ncbi:MAG: rod shape-determining protein RodA [Phycisphaerae bacterium]|nr:rod shape-determining protein RodA [Phycisphaerae bacterium]
MGEAQPTTTTRVYWFVLVPVALLVAAGMVAIYATENQAGSSRPEYTIRQAVFLVASLFAMFITIAVPYQRICRYAYVFFGIMLVLLLLLAAVRKLNISVPGNIIPVVRGSARWIRLGWFQLQPSELMKVAFILALARYLRFRENYRTWLGLMPPFLLTLLPMMLILMEPDLGTVLLMLPVLFAMLFMAGARIHHLLLVILLSILAAPVGWKMMKPYQRSRVLVLVGQMAPSQEKLLGKRPSNDKQTPGDGLSPPTDLSWSERLALAMLIPTFREAQISRKKEAMRMPGLADAEDLLDPPVITTRSLLWFNGRLDPDPVKDERAHKWIAAKLKDLYKNQGYQLKQSMVALGSGEVTGRGPWEGTFVQYDFLPDRHNDFIYAVLGHQWGLVGCVLALILYSLIIVGAVEIATGTDDPFGRLLAVGVASLIAAQVLVNVGMTVGLMPITGMTLPFVSAGGSSLITNFITVGLLVNVCRRRPLMIARQSFEFDQEVQEKPASLQRWIESRR